MSIIFFWVMGSPICTAELGLSSVSSRLEKVAPCMPSYPTLPPTMYTTSPGSGVLMWLSLPSGRTRGIIPRVPQ